MDIGRKIGRILVVEDDADTRELLVKRLLNTTPFEVTTAVSGNEAIRILKNRQDFCGIISDYNMSDGSGKDVQDFLVVENIRAAFLFYTSEENPSINLNHKFYLGKISKPNITVAVNELVIGLFKKPYNLNLN